MSIADKITSHILSSFMSILGLLSPSMGRFLGKVLGRIWFGIDKKHKRITLDSLGHAYAAEMDSHARWLLARRVFENTATMLFEHARFHTIDPDDYFDYFEITGLENFKAAQAKGRGVIVFSGHLGNWEYGSALTRLTGVTFSVVYKTIESPVMESYVKAKRSSTGCKMLPLHNALDDVFETLARGEAVGLIVDQNSRKRHQSVFVDFFGRKASANKGLARIALRTNAPAVPTLTYRKNGRPHLEFLPEIPLIRTGNEEHDILVNTQAYHAVIEDYIRQYPDQWLWLHNRWKTRPLEET
ncbi:lysophospholipid acyltransferase family protein [Desulfobacula phenolica]|uniref:KDO2-lipid IV(A) lauroyltransferase n=1 Tax=Desulfobacula phenolica TaxID=90732 RepID=A0A1H2DMT3_9BACT|nr:lysophospholipid acyltransferase family protein [Desulfobacula phenolica]SDT84247.1 KDO2-lipid IV(A) lauroyltransferase [Desulfobacula phenolica]